MAQACGARGFREPQAWTGSSELSKTELRSAHYSMSAQCSNIHAENLTIHSGLPGPGSYLSSVLCRAPPHPSDGANLDVQ